MEIEPSPFVTTIGVMGLLILSRVNPHLICWACDCIAATHATKAKQKSTRRRTFCFKAVFIIISFENLQSLISSEPLILPVACTAGHVKLFGLHTDSLSAPNARALLFHKNQ